VLISLAYEQSSEQIGALLQHVKFAQLVALFVVLLAALHVEREGGVVLANQVHQFARG
jgi:hypothetical protein